MSIPNLVPLLGSISGMLAGPELAQRAASALGIAGTPAGNLVAAASPKAIGAGIASLGAGAGVDDAVRQALSVSGAEAGNLGQPLQMPMAQPPQMPMAQPPQMPMPQPPAQMPQPPQMPMAQPPAQMPQPPQMPMAQPPAQNAFPQAQQQPASLNTGLGTLRPQQGPAMGPMTKGFV